MIYVFRVLTKNIAKNTYHLNNGTLYYKFPIYKRTNEGNQTIEVLVPVSKTTFYNNNLYFKLDSLSNTQDIKLAIEPYSSFSDNDILKDISMDYMEYFSNDRIVHKDVHAINNFMPVGIHGFDYDMQEEILLKWDHIVHKLSSKYSDKNDSKKAYALNPTRVNKVYPITYRMFKDDRFVKEYKGNAAMFLLSYLQNFEYKPDGTIVYNSNGYKYSMFKVISEDEFYQECDRKDAALGATTPFLKSFNDHGFCKEVLDYLTDDELSRNQIKDTYKALRDAMKQAKMNKAAYFIPCLKSNQAIQLQQKMDYGEELTMEEKKIYESAWKERLNEFVKLYEEKKIFYFSNSDLELDEAGELKFNSALYKFINYQGQDLEFDKTSGLVFAYDDPESDDKYPVLEAIDSKQLKALKDEIYKLWRASKNTKR